MKEGRKLFSNAAYLSIDSIFLSATGFLYWFIIGKTLAPAQYGIVATSVNLASFLSILSFFGFGGVIVKLISEYVKIGDEEKVKSIVRFSFKTVSSIAIVVSIFLIAASGMLSPVINLPSEAIILSAILLVVSTLASLSAYVLYGFQNMKRILKTNLVGSAVKIIVSSALIAAGFGFSGPLIGIIISFLILFFLRFDKALYMGDYVIDKLNIFKVYAFPAIAGNLAIVIFGNFPFIILNSLKSPSVTGIFGLAYILITPLSMIFTVIVASLFPIISQLSVSSEVKKKNYLIHLTMRYTLLIVIPLSILLIIFSDQVILFFSQSSYLAASEIIPLLVLYSIFFGITNIFLSSLYAINRQIVCRNIWLLGSAVFLALAFPLTYYFSAMGIAMSYVFSSILLFFISYISAKKYVKFQFPTTPLIKILVSGLIFFLILSSIRAVEINILVKGILTAFGMALYFLILAPMKFYTATDIKILEILSEKSPILKKQFLYLSEFFRKFTS